MEREMKPVRAAVVGCGNISGVYLQNAAAWDILDVVACADLEMGRAEQQAKKFGVPSAGTYEDVLADPDIEIVINLTVPAAHADVSLAALQAGKSVYSEKPLAIRREDGERLLKVAAGKGLLVGCAPDTFLGGGLQTARKLLDEGAIGRPIAASAEMLSRGPEHWHPDPAFFYKNGGGPLFDMGPYYLTALIALFGPIRRTTGSAKISHPYRTILSEPLHGEQIMVETPTHITGVLDFAEGVTATLTTSFDIWEAHPPGLTVYGTKGTMRVPDPNTFGGPLFLHNKSNLKGEEVPLAFGNVSNCRGIGVADLALAMRTGGEHRAHSNMAFHVLEVMHALLDASTSGQHVDVVSRCDRPQPLISGPLFAPPEAP
jgi:predicted dehydrogenase